MTAISAAPTVSCPPLPPASWPDPVFGRLSVPVGRCVVLVAWLANTVFTRVGAPATGVEPAAAAVAVGVAVFDPPPPDVGVAVETLVGVDVDGTVVPVGVTGVDVLDGTEVDVGGTGVSVSVGGVFVGGTGVSVGAVTP